jgi:hypothetical protein
VKYPEIVAAGPGVHTTRGSKNNPGAQNGDTGILSSLLSDFVVSLPGNGSSIIHLLGPSITTLVITSSGAVGMALTVNVNGW